MEKELQEWKEEISNCANRADVQPQTASNFSRLKCKFSWVEFSVNLLDLSPYYTGSAFFFFAYC